MYQTSLFFKITAPNFANKDRMLELFFKSWIDNACNNNVTFTNVTNPTINTVRVDFDFSEDAIALRLKGIPSEFTNYIDLVDSPLQ
jgi:hypothetical protein